MGSSACRSVHPFIASVRVMLNCAFSLQNSPNYRLAHMRQGALSNELLFEKLGVQSHIFVEHPVFGVGVFEYCSGGVSEASHKSGIASELKDRLDERGGIGRWHQSRHFGVQSDLFMTANGGGNNRPPGGHRFEQRNR